MGSSGEQKARALAASYELRTLLDCGKKLKQGNLQLNDNKIEGFLERTVTPIGTSAKADIPKRYLGRRVYVIITKTVTEQTHK